MTASVFDPFDADAADADRLAASYRRRRTGRWRKRPSLWKALIIRIHAEPGRCLKVGSVQPWSGDAGHRHAVHCLGPAPPHHQRRASTPDSSA